MATEHTSSTTTTSHPHIDPAVSAVFDGVDTKDHGAVAQAVATYMDQHGDGITPELRAEVYKQMYAYGVPKPE